MRSAESLGACVTFIRLLAPAAQEDTRVKAAYISVFLSETLLTALTREIRKLATLTLETQRVAEGELKVPTQALRRRRGYPETTQEEGEKPPSHHSEMSQPLLPKVTQTTFYIS